MFSWSNNNNSNSDNSNHTNRLRTSYPGMRTSAPASSMINTATTSATTTSVTGSVVQVQPIHGSIRPPPGATSATGDNYSRAKHLESYLMDATLQRSTRKVSSDDTTYDTVFQTVRGDTLILRVHLPPAVSPGAPVRAPKMTLAGVRARHAWLNSQMQITGYQHIQSEQDWSQARILLGSAVHEIIKHMQLNPPDVLEFTDSGLRAIQPNAKQQQHPQQPPSSSSSSTSALLTPTMLQSNHAGAVSTISSNGPQQSQAADVLNKVFVHSRSGSTDEPPTYETVLQEQPAALDMPPIPRTFEELDKLDREQLDQLMQDELEFRVFCNTLPIMKTYQKIATSFMEDNLRTAQSHLDKEAELKSLSEKAQSLQKQLQAKIQTFQEMERQQNQLCAPPDRKQTIRALTKAKKEALDESERVAEDWLEKDTSDTGANVDAFCKEFIERRKVHHHRAAKLELLEQYR